MKLFFENKKNLNEEYTVSKNFRYDDIYDVQDNLGTLSNKSTDDIDKFISMFKKSRGYLYIPAGTKLEPAQSNYPNYYQAYRFVGTDIEFNLSWEDVDRLENMMVMN